MHAYNNQLSVIRMLWFRPIIYLSSGNSALTRLASLKV